MKESKLDFCNCNIVHRDIIEKAKAVMVDEDEAYRLAEFFKAFSDSTRIKIMNALSEGELCVCDIAILLSISQSATSHQLKVLRQARLVKPRRDGKTVYYSLDDSHIEDIFREGLVHIREEAGSTNE
ncbi:MAG: ArsR/SmtB family transcription factor [Filifactoraceae bacterium]